MDVRSFSKFICFAINTGVWYFRSLRLFSTRTFFIVLTVFSALTALTILYQLVCNELNTTNTPQLNQYKQHRTSISWWTAQNLPRNLSFCIFIYFISLTARESSLIESPLNHHSLFLFNWSISRNWLQYSLCFTWILMKMWKSEETRERNRNGFYVTLH